MIYFFGEESKFVIVLLASVKLKDKDVKKLCWLFDSQLISASVIKGDYVGPRLEIISPWSTNAVEITQKMGIENIVRIEQFFNGPFPFFDPMVCQKVKNFDQTLFDISVLPEPVKKITNLDAYNIAEGLSLNKYEIQYLTTLSKKLNRFLTDSEVFGFSQVNSEHCRHKIFNSQFILNGKKKTSTLFQLIKKTSSENPNNIVSAYSDNVAFVKGPKLTQFAPQSFKTPEFYEESPFESVISLKAETHNFPTTVEPFNGASTGVGGEIRDRLAGGTGSVPLAGTAVYMTPYPRLHNAKWLSKIKTRNWLYQTPAEILIKASNGTSDFGNKFGQPLIVGSLFTFEYQNKEKTTAFDKVIMLAGGVGYGKLDQSLKKEPQENDLIILLGGDNYRIGMGGAAVSSGNTGGFNKKVELNAVQRSNPEMQKRVSNTIRSFVETTENPILSIHDHGAGGHLNCFIELVENTGGVIHLSKLPIGDKTLSYREVIGNESQERIGLIIPPYAFSDLKEIAERENTPIYCVGRVTNDNNFSFESVSSTNPIDLNIADFLENPPKLKIEDVDIKKQKSKLTYETSVLTDYIKSVLELEGVGCKDWLTNKVDRCVSGKVAQQQCIGPLQLPLSNLGIVALDYKSNKGIATSIGHASASSLINSGSGSINSIAEALTNIIWTPLENGLEGISLSANWMWPCNTKGEYARLYNAVKSCSTFAIQLGISIPTGKDSLSMTQNYKDCSVDAPGTVIISASGVCNDISNVVRPQFKFELEEAIYFIDLSLDKFELGGSAFSQILNSLEGETPVVKDAQYFKKVFNLIQKEIAKKTISAGHDVSNGGLITTLLELCFSDNQLGASIDLSCLNEDNIINLLFSEKSGLVIQTNSKTANQLKDNGVFIYKIGEVTSKPKLKITLNQTNCFLDIRALRTSWLEPSRRLDALQSNPSFTELRYTNLVKNPLIFVFPKTFTNQSLPNRLANAPIAVVLREKGSNSEREMANALYMAGFKVRDVHMTDLVSGRETLEDVQFLAAVGGFSNSDVLGAAKGWAGAFLYNENANRSLVNFFKRNDVLSLGICNGCQLFIELNLIYPEHTKKAIMKENLSGKFECVFSSVSIPKNNSVMLNNLEGTILGIWSANREGRFSLPLSEDKYNIVAKFSISDFPQSPNGSNYNTAMLCSKDGRHLVSMPHFERSVFPWNWAYYPNRTNDVVSPWLQAFINAREWLMAK